MQLIVSKVLYGSIFLHLALLFLSATKFPISVATMPNVTIHEMPNPRAAQSLRLHMAGLLPAPAAPAGALAPTLHV